MNNFMWILFLLVSFILVACHNEIQEDSTESASDEIQDVISSTEENNDEPTLMLDIQIQDIITKNLNEMEESVQSNFDERLMPIDETTFAAETSTEEAENIVKDTKKDFKHLVAEDTLDEWVRFYLYSAYVSYHREYLNSDDIQTRFTVIDQTENQFEVNFITLENEGGISYIAGTHHLDYIMENEYWVFKERDFISPEEKPLNLTFQDLKENYSYLNENLSFKIIEETIVDGVKHLVYQIDGRYYARNANNSMINYDIIDDYNIIID